MFQLGCAVIRDTCDLCVVSEFEMRSEMECVCVGWVRGTTHSIIKSVLSQLRAVQRHDRRPFEMSK